MSEKPPLTTEAGTPVIDNRHSQTAGPAGADRPRGRHRGGVPEVTSAHYSETGLKRPEET
jgi:hypothetical protein